MKTSPASLAGGDWIATSAVLTSSRLTIVAIPLYMLFRCVIIAIFARTYRCGKAPGFVCDAAQDASVTPMTTREAIADADGDIAALVYTSGDRPDFVLSDFARHLAATGRRASGLVQFRDRPLEKSARRLLLAESRQLVEVTRRHDGPCSLDADWLDRMGGEAKASIRRGVDAGIVNRFGPLEAAGRGFRDAILAAWETETPLVVAVPVFEFERWTRFSGGMTVRLDCTLDSVMGWWRGVSTPGARALAAERRACALFK